MSAQLALWVACAAPLSAQEGALWSEGPPMPTCRSELAAALLEGGIYAVGGLAHEGALDAVERYDLTTRRWERRAPLRQALHHIGMAAVGGHLYVTGGYEGKRLGSPQNRATWRYDPAADRWTAGPDLPAPRAAHAMVAVRGRLYIVGGTGPRAQEVWRLDPAKGRWEVVGAPLPTPREHLAAAVYEGTILAIAGRWHDAGNLRTVERLNPATGTWETLPRIPRARGGLTAAVIGDSVHVTGGEVFVPLRTLDEHDVLQMRERQWHKEPPLPLARHGLASVATAGRWYVIGGGAEAGMRTFETATCRMDIYSPFAAGH